MEQQLLKKYITSKASNELFEDAIDKLNKLKKQTDNFKIILKNKKIILTYKNRKLFSDFLYSFYCIYKFINIDGFITELKDTSSESEMFFWNSVIDYVESSNISNKETTFLREMDIDKFKDLVMFIFNKNILYNGYLEEYKEWDIEKIKVTWKTLNTFLYNMIDEFNDLESLQFDLNIKFKFNKEKYEYIWNLCEQNKIYLMLKNITEKLNMEYYDEDTPE